LNKRETGDIFSISATKGVSGGRAKKSFNLNLYIKSETSFENSDQYNDEFREA